MTENVFPIVKLWFYPFCILFIRKIKGIENIPEEGNFIVVANHEHYVDPLYIYYPILKKLNKKMHFVASPKWWPYLGDKICGQWAGCIPAYNGRTYDKAKQVALSGEIIGIFPEGHLKEKIRIPKSGAVMLALETKIPILPIGIKSSYIPFNTKINIGQLVFITDKKDIKGQMLNIINNVFTLKRMQC